jgi:2-polyprenyl-3-methyl-5-hydroxy-6-metoxy-1,4-benzoquinol methylase
VANPIAEGTYARKQIFCPNRVVAWSHASRFRLAARLASGAAAGGTLLDYGCGDGTFLALTHGTFRHATGADVDEPQLDDCRRRFAHLGRLDFVTTASLEAQSGHRRYDAVTCMEVLEHCPDDERLRVLEALRRLAAPGGRVIISVPIEIGPALVGKQTFRALAAWRGHGDYHHRETYTARELMAAALARRRLSRAEYTLETPTGPRRYCGHKGFDWRILAREVEARFTSVRTLYSPMNPVGSLMNSQAWFVCSVR